MPSAPQSSTRKDLFTENDPNTIRQGIMGYGVFSGLDATPGTGLQIAIASGSAYFNSSKVTQGSITYVSIDAVVTYPRRDIVVMDSSGVISVVKGTEGPIAGTDTKFQTYIPYPPTLPPGNILLAEVYIDSTMSSFGSTDILDKRVILDNNVVRTSEKIVMTSGVNIDFYASDGNTLIMRLDADGNLSIKGIIQQL